jgi:hypothetical protein
LPRKKKVSVQRVGVSSGSKDGAFFPLCLFRIYALCGRKGLHSTVAGYVGQVSKKTTFFIETESAAERLRYGMGRDGTKRRVKSTAQTPLERG